MKNLDNAGLHHSGFDVARGKSGIRHHQKLDLERHPEKAQATHRKLRAKDRPLVNDFISDEAFEALLLAWFSNASRVLRPGGSFYVWGGYANLGNYPAALKAAGLYFSQAIIWDKEHPVLTRKDLMGAHEWALYGWKEGAAHRFFGPSECHRPLARQEGQPQRDGPPHREAGRAGAAGHRVQLACGRCGARPLRRLGLHAGRLRTDRSSRIPHGDRPAVLRRRGRSFRGVQWEAGQRVPAEAVA